MSKTMIVSLALVIICGGGGASIGTAQQNSFFGRPRPFRYDHSEELIKAADCSLRSSEPDWDLIPVRVSGPHFRQEDGVRYQWLNHAGERVDVLVAQYVSSTEAGQRVESLLKGARRSERLEGLVEEAYEWRGQEESSRSGVCFRVGNTVIIVHAPTGELAERFAHYLAEQAAAVKRSA